MKNVAFLFFSATAAASFTYGFSLCGKIDFLEIRTAEIAGPFWWFIPWMTRLTISMIFVFPLGLVLQFFFPCKRLLRFSFLLSLPLLLSDLLNPPSVEPTVWLSLSDMPGAWYLLAGLPAVWLAPALPPYPLAQKRIARSLWYISLTVALSLPFILNPVYPEDFRSSPFSPTPVQLYTLKAYLPQTANQTQLLCFYTHSCPFCKKAAKKLYVTLEPPLRNQIVAVFGGEPEGIEDFFTETGTDFLYASLPDSVFYEWAGNSWPSFMLVKNDTLLYRWNGKTLNYRETNRLPGLLSP